MKVKKLVSYFYLGSISFFSLIACSEPVEPIVNLEKGSSIVLIGNNLGSRMMNYGYFETEIQQRFPDSLLFVRNMCDGGNTPGFRPHSGRNEPWAFPGADKFQTELARRSGSVGHFESPDEWIGRLNADVILAFFGYSESFEGPEGLENFEGELSAFIDHTLSQKYNGATSPQLVLISPTAYENLSDQYDLPDGVSENRNLKLYRDKMREVASEKKVAFIDVYDITDQWFSGPDNYTIDGFQMTESAYEEFSSYLATQIFGTKELNEKREEILNAVLEKNWFWHNDYKIPNGVHVFGRRYDPFGPDNYPYELKKIRQMTAIRDTAIWMTAMGKEYDVTKADDLSLELPPVTTNYQPEDEERLKYLYGEEALDKFETAPGYKIELFASESEFPDLANPVQLSFDNKGRLWVATMPSYPHYKPGDTRPDDKLIILEDTDGDNKADKQTVFAEGLHLPIGFEFAPEGVYVSQGTNLILLQDTDGDDHADTKEIILSGFDDHDTHHAISAFTTDPSGAIFMGEGVFLHTNVETPYGPVRATNGGFYRYSPQRRRLERTAQLSIPNPWGIAVDEWGQNFFAETSGPDVLWMYPGSVKSRYGVATRKSVNLIENEHRVRPTSGLEFVHSRHFPDEVQGDLLINNTIGFLGTKQHTMKDDGTGYSSEHRLDMVRSTDGNFRPVDMEIAPDGSLYLVDWHNILIGHMQHNARDPLRDHVHGRIYRITYPSRPLVTPAKVDGADISDLLDNLTLPEYRTRYRSRRELRARDSQEVRSAIDLWVTELDENDPRLEHHLLEALWVTWGLNQVHESLLRELLQAKDYRVRAAAVRVLRYMGHQVDGSFDLMMQAASDDHGRVRLEAIVAASWLEKEEGLAILEMAASHPLDDWMVYAHQTAIAHLNDRAVDEIPKVEETTSSLTGDILEQWKQGQKIFNREGHCITCHQVDGKGLPASGFPPLAGTDWVTGDKERLIKIVLKGLMGPIEVNGTSYPGQVPMTPFERMLDDKEIAAVLTYVRNSFGNEAGAITEEEIAKVRALVKDRQGFFNVQELQ